MNNDTIEAEEVNSVYQKENNPPCVGPDREGSTEKEIQTAISETNETAAQFVTTRSGVPKNPLTVRNMAAQPPSRKTADQVQLLEKFKKLRQWQQQQQDSLFRQQQQQMETIKMEQNKLQSILAAQKSLQEQRIQNVASQQPSYTASNLNPQNLQNQNVFDDQKEKRQYSIAQMQLLLDTVTKANAESNNTETNPVVFPTSSNTSLSLSFPHTVPVSRSMTSQHSRQTVVQETVDSGTYCFNQQQLQPDYILEGSMGSFNNTMYPTMWNLPNNHNLPLGAIPLTSGTGVVPSQMLSSNPQLITDISTPNLPASHMGTIVSKNREVSLGNQPSSGTHELDRLWKHNPRSGIDDDLESQCDNQSEADAMSGVYPLCDSESEMIGNEDDDSERNESDRNVGSDDEEDALEETPYDENTTVVEIDHQCPTGKSEKEEGKNTFDEDSDEARPIKPGIGGLSSARTFEELLEEQLRLDEVKSSSTTIASKKPCRPFLRKGQGLKRYNKGKSALVTGNAGGPTQESTSQAVVLPHARKGKKGAVPVQSKQGSQQSKVTRKVATKSPQVVPTEPNREPILTKRQLYESSLSSGGLTDPSKSTATAVATNKTLAAPRTAVVSCTSVTNSIDASFQMKMREWEENRELEEEELEEFELLEQAAANASFSSNSSVVVRMLTKARGEATAPDKKHVAKDVAVQGLRDNRGNVLSPVDTGYGSEDGKVLLSEGIVANRHFEPQEFENGSNDEDSDVTLQEMSLDSALDLEACEDDRKRILSTQQHVAHLEEKAHSYPVSTSSLAIEEDFNDEEAWGAIKTQSGTKSDKNKNDDSDSDDDDDSDVTISDIFPLGSSTPPAQMKAIQSKTEKVLHGKPEDFVTSTPPTSALVTKLFPQLKPKQQKTVTPPVTQPIDTHAPFIQEKEADSSRQVHSHAVREKLKQLETEIEKFRVENAALAKMRVEREEGLNKLRNEIAAFEKQKTEELERLETFREEELRKLRRERKVFEKYQKAARAIPDKKERDEIESLRGQVSELQEELKRRESRWSAASTRYRQKIDSLEKQNKELQDELKLLEQYRLQQWREEEQSEVKEADDTRPKKPLLRKTIKATEEETGPRLPPSHGSPPDIPTFVESAVKSTSDAFSPDNRNKVTDENTSDSKPGKINKEKNSGEEILSGSGKYSLEALTARKGGEAFDENHSSKRRSPRRRRSKTPDSVEKKRKNVRFEDDSRAELGETKEGNDMANLQGMSREREIVHVDGKVERVNSDGSRVISFANGTSKEISADGQTLTVTFFNGDVKQILPDQRVIYYYSDVQTTHTTYPDGLEVLQFPSKQIEKHYRDGTKEIIFPDQTIKYLYPNGAEECVFSDGTIQRVSVEGDRTIEFPNGQRETHTKYYKKREYPDGTVKTVYPDGRTETRYSTGRVRVKDRDGRVLVDTADQSR